MAKIKGPNDKVAKSGEIMVPVAPGELLDKITILEIKSERIKDAAKLTNVRFELAQLSRTRDTTIAPSPALEALVRDLKQANERLWEIEDEIRACEADQDFGRSFIELARSVYVTNDRRAALKREINKRLGSRILEEKSYTDYAPREE